MPANYNEKTGSQRFYTLFPLNGYALFTPYTHRF